MAIKSLIFFLLHFGTDNLNDNWCFFKGADKGVKVTLPFINDCKVIDLPHNILAPNTALWYQKNMMVAGDVFLYVKADDGAQVFQDGRQLSAEKGYYYKLQKADKSCLTIRVLNNAMKGGLKELRFVNKIPENRNETKVTAFTAAQNLKDLKLKSNSGLSFSVWSDSQSGWSIFHDIIRRMSDYDDDFSIGLGDFVNDGFNHNEWIKFSEAVQPLARKMPVFTIPGNHDYDGYYDQLFPYNYYVYTNTPFKKKSYYSFYKNYCYFITLDPNCNFPLGIDEAQREWLKRELKTKRYKSAKWKFLLVHQPPYAQGWTGYDGEDFMKSLLQEFDYNQKLDFVFSGHNHNYERKVEQVKDHNICYIITGGAGGGLELEHQSNSFSMDKIIKKHHFCRIQIDKNNAILIVYGIDGNEIDYFKITKN